MKIKIDLQKFKEIILQKIDWETYTSLTQFCRKQGIHKDKVYHVLRGTGSISIARYNLLKKYFPEIENLVI